ncbi:hypothetical protein VPIG_00197 [Vibrio phage PWH3a-P1]|uniref:hypothetical protein n=1 Tax=Vibrio phage PWH3a-P1 TaxID=754058 RepID=UPI0002C1051B|nr:hypothetical protein VPIG_00197 [Vibrio phage PWH3a-P1]AGH32053.1 hypothetical protein VPIG_00197 [Vibrio phage PWH3a-P1]
MDSGDKLSDDIFNTYFKRAVKVIEQTQSKQHYVDYIKARILYEEGLHETLESLNNYTLCELFWLYERIVVRDMILDARERDEKVREQITQTHR